MKVDCIIGIDPGANGGIVTWRPNYRTTAIKMPKDIKELDAYLRHLQEVCNPIVFLEKLSIRPDDVSVGEGGANMGKLYRIQKMIANYEELKVVISLTGVPFCLVHPMKWQSALSLRLKGKKEEKSDRKKRYKEIAGRKYPDIKATLWNADATLIMHFGRHVLANDINWVKTNLPKDLHDKLF